MALEYPSVITVADQVKTDLNTHFTGLGAVRENVPRAKKTELYLRKTTVVPTKKKVIRENRGDTTKVYTIDIGIQQNIEDPKHADALTEDDLVKFAEEVLDWWMDDKKTLTGYAVPSDQIIIFVDNAELLNDVPFDVGAKRDDGLFHAVVRLTLKALVC